MKHQKEAACIQYLTILITCNIILAKYNMNMDAGDKEEIVRRRVAAMNNARKKNTATRNEAAKREALEQFTDYYQQPLFTLGLGLYWGEGDKKTRYQVRLTNTDPELIRTFLNFLEAYAKEFKDRIWISVIRYEGTDKTQCERFWQEKTDLIPQQFQKTVTVKSRGIERKSPYGICVIGISSVKLKIKMLAWIAELEKRM